LIRILQDGDRETWDDIGLQRVSTSRVSLRVVVLKLCKAIIVHKLPQTRIDPRHLCSTNRQARRSTPFGAPRGARHQDESLKRGTDLSAAENTLSQLQGSGASLAQPRCEKKTPPKKRATKQKKGHRQFAATCQALYMPQEAETCGGQELGVFRFPLRGSIGM